MDNFTKVRFLLFGHVCFDPKSFVRIQGMLERAEKRSKQLGISTTTKFPTMSPMKENKSPRRSNKELATVSSNGSPLKTTKVTNNVNKDNADVAVEINITSNQNIQVIFFSQSLILILLDLEFSKASIPLLGGS